MDWYYPVLGGAVGGAAAKQRIDAAWDRFVVPGLGVRCVLPNNWVTGGESCELALTLWVMGESDRALEILQSIRHLRADDGLYWTGYVFDDRALWLFVKAGQFVQDGAWEGDLRAAANALADATGTDLIDADAERLARRVLSTMAVRDEGWPLPRFLRCGV